MGIGQIFVTPLEAPGERLAKPVSNSGGEPASPPVVQQKAATKPRAPRNQEAVVISLQKQEKVLSKPPDLERHIKETMERINRYLREHRLDLHFYLHKGVGRLALQVIQDSTGKILREYPPKEWLDLEAKLREMVGVFVDVDNA